MANRLLLRETVEVEVHETALRAEMKYEARVYPVKSEHERGTPLVGHGETPAQAARKAMGWFVNDRLQRLVVTERPKKPARRSAAR